MVPLYILGLLQRYGPQHGYRIKKIMAQQLSDFTQIKLPTIYYHLAKMEADGLLRAESEKPGSRPEKTVYSITQMGMAAYRGMLSEQLCTEYRLALPMDAIFYFSDQYEPQNITRALQTYADKLRRTLAGIERHRDETLSHVPDDAKTMVNVIFSHHLHHYRAELAWADETLRSLAE